MNAQVNVRKIYAAMKAHGWGRRDTCVNCHLNNKTLDRLLEGAIPRRIDVLYRLCDGLGLKIEDALVNHPSERSPNVISLRKTN
jgi:transcriptional regulator with XRE-family HTH domain